MAGNIFVLHEQQRLTEFAPTLFDNEGRFQEIIAQNPSILAGDQMTPENPRRWLLIAREMGVPAEQDGSAQWSLDHLFLDQDGVPTLVEVKRSTDTRLRREVVGQMLDYAANGSAYWPFEEIMRLHDESGTSLAEIGVAPDGEEDYWGKVKTNLRAGKLRLLFVADKIPAELRCIIEFLNKQMEETEVYGVEIRYYSSEGISAFVPSLIGQAGEALQAKKRESRVWDEPSFLGQVEHVSGKDGRIIAEKLLRVFEEFDCSIFWGRGKEYGSATVRTHDRKRWMFSIQTTGRRTTLQLFFLGLTEKQQLLLKEQFEQIPGISIDDNRLTKYPSFDLLLLRDQQLFNKFIYIIESHMMQPRKEE